ncbi:MAG TPA: hypothetical protein VID48_12760, partial [Solirubrobacteraceae bacterium]
HDDIASPLFRAKERLSIFGGLRIAPVITVDPGDGSLSFSFDGARRAADLNATLERLLELPGVLAGERKRQVVLILDEFQEITDIDPALPKLMRSVFQEQPEVAHIYLGSKRHMMERLFNDENEPFWRSAKQLELDIIDAPLFGDYILGQFKRTRRKISTEALDAVLDITRGHPYATQELCYFLWALIPAAATAGSEDVARALDGVLDSEHAHFSLIWQGASAHQRQVLLALARESGHPFSGEYRRRHSLPAVSSVQRALIGLEKGELVDRRKGLTWISEPFLGEWIRRDQGA